MKNSKFSFYDYVVLPLSIPVIFYFLDLKFELSSQTSSHIFVQVIFILALVDINRNKLNDFDQKYLIIAVILFVYGRVNLLYSLGTNLRPSDLLIIIFCGFRSLKLLLSLVNISLLEKSSHYKLIVICVLIGTPLIILMVPQHKRCGKAGNPKRACYANLNTLTGAIEMYELDMGYKFEINGLESYQELVKNRYMQSFRMCPKNKNSNTPYVKIIETSEICCEVHGCISDPVKN